jgi:hypothetical protein
MSLINDIWQYTQTQPLRVITLEDLGAVFPQHSKGVLSQACASLVRRQRLARVRPGAFRVPWSSTRAGGSS